MPRSKKTRAERLEAILASLEVIRSETSRKDDKELRIKLSSTISDIESMIETEEANAVPA